MNINDYGEGLIPGRPAPTPEQYAAECELARKYLEKHAPDLVDMVIGGAV